MSVKRNRSKQPQSGVTPALVSQTAQATQLNQGHYFLFFLMFLGIFACYQVFRPYLNAIIIAIILAILFQPMYRKVAWFCGGRRSLAAFLVCLFLTLAIVIPLIFVVLALIQQGVQSFNAIYAWIDSGAYRKLFDAAWVKSILSYIDEYLPDIQKIFPNFDVTNLGLDKMSLQLSQELGKKLLNQGGNLVSNMSAVVAQSFLMLFAFFFILRDQEKISAALLHLSPLSHSQERQILDKVKTVAQSALLGTFLTAIAQGCVAGIAFSIAHLPGLFWGTMIAFASLIPVVGTALIWLPASLYLLLSGHWGYSLFMFLWCAVLVGLIDNIVRPLFMKGAGESMGTLVIFFSLFGGINYFGLIGILYGPLIVGLTIVVLYIYRLEFKDFLTHQDHS